MLVAPVLTSLLVIGREKKAKPRWRMLKCTHVRHSVALFLFPNLFLIRWGQQNFLVLIVAKEKCKNTLRSIQYNFRRHGVVRE